MPPSFFHHLHPPTIPARQARFRHTLGAGGAAVFFSLILLLTGILEMFFYVPLPERAALSVQEITFLVPYGALIRGLHFWAAQCLLLAAGLHLFRVIFTGGYAAPRRFNYALGWALSLLLLLMDFTGYLLRWDEGIRWALVAGTNLIARIPLAGKAFFRVLVGGGALSAEALLRFYAWHVFGLGIFALVLGVWHLFRVRRDGGIALPPPNRRADRTRISRGELLRREALAMLVLTAGLLFLALVFPAPLASPLETTAPPEAEAFAPWFFLWVQGLLRLGNPALFGVWIPAAVVTLWIAIPFLFPRVTPGEWFPPDGRGARILAGILLAAILLLSLFERFVPVS